MIYPAINAFSIRHPTRTADNPNPHAIIPAIGSGIGAISNPLSESLITIYVIYLNKLESQDEVDRYKTGNDKM